MSDLQGMYEDAAIRRRQEADRCPLCGHRWHGLTCTWPTYPPDGTTTACGCVGEWASKESA